MSGNKKGDEGRRKIVSLMLINPWSIQELKNILYFTNDAGYISNLTRGMPNIVTDRLFIGYATVSGVYLHPYHPGSR